MNDSRIVPFVKEHLDLFEMRDSEKDRLELDPMAAMKLEALAQFGIGGTVFYDGRAIGIIGYYEMWPGVYEVWAFPSIYVKQYATIYLKHVRRYIQVIEEAFKPHRLQTTAIADDLHDDWMTFLGFKQEGDLKAYSVNKQDHRMWARLYGSE